MIQPHNHKLTKAQKTSHHQSISIPGFWSIHHNILSISRSPPISKASVIIRMMVMCRPLIDGSHPSVNCRVVARHHRLVDP